MLIFDPAGRWRARPVRLLRGEASAEEQHLVLATIFSSELVYSGEVGLFQVGMLIKNLFLGHTSTQPAQNVPNWDAQALESRDFHPACPAQW